MKNKENKFTENAEMQSGNPAELSDDDLDSVSGGFSSENPTPFTGGKVTTTEFFDTQNKSEVNPVQLTPVQQIIKNKR